MNTKNNLSKVMVKAPKNGDLPELKLLNYSEMYDFVAKFIQKVILIKDIDLTIANRTSLRVSIPKRPFILLCIEDIYDLPELKTYIVDNQEISLIQSEVMMNILFFGNEQISSIELAEAFQARFNKGWATEQFAQYSKAFIPLYSNNLRVKPFCLGITDQLEDRCSVDAYFELHPEIVEHSDNVKERD
ncbi:unnamed protein product [Commensalibacter communis]|uniref:Uncharacterized protein n=1 Tax=Commensalibacter communis TaxID=2972786 RepID=A0A9W4X7P5_9PROT|nr:hypothetical protein [Commensalibacter communis]CAI3956403.1 unnamed protein product [Commensalibacter communis]CAI3958337.1 unnamed protein product [Commensalibacter communis]CAI3959470.1 unnamed protein product [Commensalibacter communis]CAI3959907.1 unnamed protein product [Commensalibacter communis]